MDVSKFVRHKTKFIVEPKNDKVTQGGAWYKKGQVVYFDSVYKTPTNKALLWLVADTSKHKNEKVYEKGCGCSTCDGHNNMQWVHLDELRLLTNTKPIDKKQYKFKGFDNSDFVLTLGGENE